LGRRANRTKAAWTIVLPLLAVYAVLHIVEGIVDRHSLTSLTPFLCAIVCEMLRSLALGLALLLTVSDRLKFRSRVLRATLIFVVLLAAGSAAVTLNAPLVSVRSAKPVLSLSPALWRWMFGAGILIFMIGLSFLSAVLRWLTRGRALPWCAGVCFALGIALIVGLTEIKLLGAQGRFMSNQDFPFLAGELLGSLLGPYLVFFWFLLPALWSRFYRQRFTNCFVGGALPSQGD